jgi:hypothetical protein
MPGGPREPGPTLDNHRTAQPVPEPVTVAVEVTRTIGDVIAPSPQWQNGAGGPGCAATGNDVHRCQGAIAVAIVSVARS